MDSSPIRPIDISQQQLLIERLRAAISAAGLRCWEVSLTENRITWYGDLPQDEESGNAELARRQAQVMASLLPEDSVRANELIAQADKNGDDTLSTVVRHRRADGGLTHLRLHFQFFRDANGRAQRAIGTSHDITAEVEAAERLRQRTALLEQSELRLERASLSTQQGHYEIDLATGGFWASKSYRAVLGYSADNGLALNTLAEAAELIHPDDRQAVEDGTRRLLEGSGPYDAETRLRLADGSYRWFRVRGIAEFAPDGRPLTMSGSISDIHKQHLAEDALREVQLRFERAIQGTQDGLWEIEVSSQSLWTSPRISELLGFADGQLGDQARRLRSRAHPDDSLSLDHSMLDAVQTGTPVDLEIRMRMKDGGYRWFRLRGTAQRDSAGAVCRISGSMQDVTDAHVARDELVKASEAAQAANRAKSDFLANVSHEIRTPMNGVIGMTRVLLDTELDNDQRDCVETIRSSADSLMSIINDILDFSKIEAGKLDIESLELSVADTVDEVGTIMSFAATAKGLELIVDTHPEIPGVVLGDPQRIRQCLINLIGNAIKFTRSGEIVCEVKVLHRSREHVRLRFEIRDTGIGISPTALQSLFEPFVQADSSTTRHFGGTGLGLSIVRRLVEMMGGNAGVDSEVNKGSTFWFELPMPLTTAASATTDSRTPSPAIGKCILVVDDNETSRLLLQTQLRRVGYKVTPVASGEEAMIALREAAETRRHFDVVLTDHQMPGMDGPTLCERINSDAALSHTRVVLLTSVENHRDKQRLASMGCSGCLSKPIRLRELLALLDEVLNGSAQPANGHPAIAPGAENEPEPGRNRSFGKVLLVEDNLVNQKVAQRFLQRMGCEVQIAGNGMEAVQAFEKDAFRLILMDVQMPMMDGYEATERIRTLENASGRVGPRVPIVALTANAMSGQLDKCLAAGMDALLTKPLDVRQLEKMLARFGSHAPAESDEYVAPGAMTGASKVGTTLNPSALSEISGGDAGFAGDLARNYLNHSRDLYVQMTDCVNRDNRSQLARLVHELAGGSAYLQAITLAELCRDLEKAAASASIRELDVRIGRIGAELTRVGTALRQEVDRLRGSSTGTTDRP